LILIPPSLLAVPENNLGYYFTKRFFAITILGAMAGVCAEFSQHYVQPLEDLHKGDSVRYTLKEVLVKIKSGRAGMP
jgi:hypothetical protein